MRGKYLGLGGEKYYRCKWCKTAVVKASGKTDVALMSHLRVSHPELYKQASSKFIQTIIDENFYIGEKYGSGRN